MNIIIINHYAGSDEYGMEFRPLYLSRELVKLGHSVTVLAASYSHLRKKQPDVQKDFDEELIDGVRYVYFKTPAYRRNDHMRFLNIFCFYQKVKKNSERIAERFKPDAVVGSSTYPNDVKLAKCIADFNGAKVAYEIHDIWPLSLIELYHFSIKNPLIRFLQKAENFAYENSDVVISILSAADRHIKELGYNNVDFVHVPNGISESGESTPAPDSIKSAVSDFKQNGEFVCMYLGGFAKANALDEFVASAKYLPENARLVLIGDGLLKVRLEEIIKENELKNVAIFDSVPKSSVNETLKLADCLYIGAKQSNLYKYGIGMNKLFDYMLSARPIICGIDAEDNPIALANCGEVIPAQDEKAIADAIAGFAEMPYDEREKIGEKGRKYVLENHNYSVLAEKFADALR